MTSTPASMRSTPLASVRSRAAVLLGATAVLVATAVIWAVRLRLGEAVYISQLGATGMPTAPAFNAALLTLGLGAVLVALGSRGRRSRLRGLAAWSTATTLAVAGGAFVVASRVTCTAGCPVPLTPGSTVQDLVHVVVAVVGFAAASWAMLQVAWSDGSRVLQVLSRVAAISVALIAATGGMLSVLQVRTDLGATAEFVAMTVAVSWMAVFAVSAAQVGRTRHREPLPA